ncbi:carboxylate--amine ligase [Cupriavidus sp. BIC8F]|uniref:carboxylate--amine ligase n=1 Tax=Cupriavidus sp. BIC8F TaxID=3079014 RepID=UPI0029161F6B|nr:carboxylate--amine ligase [Cupriavidus sp. BIC8F]
MLRMPDSTENAAVVIVGGDLNGLGLVRSLANQKMPIIAVDTTSSKAALWSRHARRCVIRSFKGQDFVEDMIALGKRFEKRPVLFLTDEDAVHTVSENRPELGKWFRFRLPPDTGVKLLSNKSEFHRFAEQNGFPVPHTEILNGTSDLPLLSRLRFPCIIKPDDKRYALSGDKERAVRADSLDDAMKHAGIMLRTPGGIVAQEWIEGPESNIYFTLFYRGENGKIAAIFTGRKLLCSPRDIGSTAICIAAPEAGEALEPMTLAIANCADFYGMGSMEYKWDSHYKRFMIIEPTVGRTDWQEEIATLCGVNIPLAAYRYELGLPAVPSVTVPSHVAWRSTFAERAPRHLLTNSFRIFDGYFRWSDPLPAVQHYCISGSLGSRIMRQWTVRRNSTSGEQIQWEER